jgi:ComF family protein
MLRYLANFFYPPRCAGCDARMPLETSRRVCGGCVAKLDRIDGPICSVCGIPLESFNSGADGWCETCAKSPPHFGLARAIVRYRPGGDEDTQLVASLIRRHKYGPDQSLSHALAECLGDPLPLRGGDYDVVIPVPLHPARLRWRGFNQAAMLAEHIARDFDRPLDVRTLARRRPTPPQTSQDSRQRRLNVRQAFAVTHSKRVANRRILLVDDVMTTGATADECARTLLAAGARRVDVMTLARAV